MEALSFQSSLGRILLPQNPVRIRTVRRRYVAPVQTTILSALSYDTKETKIDSLALQVRDDFPALHQEVNGLPLVYLDNAATSQKPHAVINAMKHYFEFDNSNVHRGVHTLGARATEAYESAREKVARFINSPSSRQIVFTRNASEAINLVAYSWGLTNLKPGDEIVLSVAEHHSNIVPWQLIAKKTGSVLRFAQLTTEQSVDMEHLLSLINNKTQLVSIHHVSNTLGSGVDVEAIVAKAHGYGSTVLLDACQSVPHMPVDVQALDIDFMAVSAHKMCGPTGIGFLYGKKELLQNMPPFMGGGEMIQDVFFEESTFAEPPSRFEAGTPAIAEAVGLGAACDYLTKIGMDRIHDYETKMGVYLYQKLEKLPGVSIYGPPPSLSPSLSPSRGGGRASLCSFNVEGIHGTDLAVFLDQQHGVAVRSGHHCTQPLHRLMGVNSSARASLYFYNTKNDVDKFIDGLADTIDFFTNIPKS